MVLVSIYIFSYKKTAGTGSWYKLLILLVLIWKAWIYFIFYSSPQEEGGYVILYM